MPDKIPNKLVFSASSESKGRKKKTFLLVGFLAGLQLCLIWPVYPLFASARPLIFGFPLSFVWVIGILLIAFFTMLIYYRYDIRHSQSKSGDQ